MPTFSLSFGDLKGLANSLIPPNPLNAFSEPSPAEPSSSTRVPPPVNPRTTPSPAVAGPGPSSQASRLLPSSLPLPRPSSLFPSRPIRPSLNSESSISSLEDGSGPRRSSAASVVIAEPEVEGGDDRPTRRKGIDGMRKASRPLSAGSGFTGISTETKKRKKAPLDTYIIVKPPSTSSKFNLSLQIQLVVQDPRGRDRSESNATNAMSMRSNSVSTQLTSISAPASPNRSTIDFPPSESISQVVELSSSAGSNPPRSDSPDPVVEADATTPGRKDLGSGLRRTSSLRSSVSSAASGSLGARKRVEPMFNLAVHNVVHSTVVTDAATDVKVAKFLKRTLDVTGVGILEPSEVWLPVSDTASAANLAPTISRDDSQSRQSGPSRPSRPSPSGSTSVASLTTPLSPTATRSTTDGVRSSLDMSLKRASLDLKNFRLEGEGGAKKFFGKMFKKKTGGDLIAPQMGIRPSISVRKTSPSSSFSSLEPGSPSLNGIFNPSVVVKPPSSQPSPMMDQTFLTGSPGHPTFGTAPMVIQRRSSGTIVSPNGAVTGLTAPSGFPGTSSTMLLGDAVTVLPMLPSSRPVGYTWTVRKWAKKNTEGWAAHLVAAAAAGLEMVNGPVFGDGDGDGEVVFEWVKLRLPANAVGSSIMRRYSTAGTTTSSSVTSRRNRSRQDTVATIATEAESTKPVSVQANPPSPDPSAVSERPNTSSFSASVSSLASKRKGSPSPPIERDGNEHSSTHTSDLSAGEDSDPEDSETPWTCSVWVKKTGQRQLLGTLTPAPHHPKVVGVLKIPMHLESVCLANVKEKVGQAKNEEMANRVREEVSLTEENLKDVVCVSALWLVAREEFGGLRSRGKRKA